MWCLIVIDAFKLLTIVLEKNCNKKNVALGVKLTKLANDKGNEERQLLI